MIWRRFSKTSASKKVRRYTPQQLKLRPLCEALEDRTLLAAVQAAFILDPATFTSATNNTNYLNMTGSGVNAGVAFSLAPQAGTASAVTSSLRSPASGKVVVQFDPNNPTSGITFLSALLDADLYRNPRTSATPTNLLPGVGGNPPASSSFGAPAAPADFGANITVAGGLITAGKVAIRNFTDSISSGLVPVTGSGPSYNFSAQAQTFSTTGGSLDFNIFVVNALLGINVQQAGTTSVAGQSVVNNSTTPASLVNLNNAQGQWRLTLPVMVTANLDTDNNGTPDTTLITTGSIVGTFTPPVVDLNGSDGAGNDFATTATSGGPAVRVTDTDATVMDGDSANLTQATVAISSPVPTELLALDLTGLPGLSQNFSGGQLTITGSASTATYQDALRRVMYSESSVTATGSRTLTFVVTDPDGNTSTPRTTTISLNRSPVVSVVLSDHSPRTNDILTATATASDPDGDAVLLSYVWKVNGSVVAGETGSTLNLGLAGHGDKGQTVSVEVTASDGRVGSATTASDSATVVNSVPTVAVSLNTMSPQAGDTLLATTTPSDDDGDSVTLTFVWKVNGTVVPGATTSTFSTTGLAAGDVVRVEVTPNDGTTAGPTAFKEATVFALVNVADFQVNDGAVQRSLVTSLTVTFTGVANLPTNAADAFEVIGPNGSVSLNAAVTTDALGRTVVRLTFTGGGTQFGSLLDGSYSLRVRADRISNLDGDGDTTAEGSPMDDRSFAFHRRYGDLDGDGDVSALVVVHPTRLPRVEYRDDFGAMAAALGPSAVYNAALDLDHDGDVDSTDFVQGGYHIDSTQVIFE